MDAPRDVVVLSMHEDTAEMSELVRALGYRIVETVVQNRSRPDPDTYLGVGKLREVRERLAERDPHPIVSAPRVLVVVDAALKPPQLFGIEDVVGTEVWDRIRVILEIFQQKAQVKEARLQVELARLRYELPFVHEALHRTLTGEHPGFMGGGELPMRAYETHLKRRTRRILDELRSVKRERANRREGRRRSGFRLVAIAGYTNSGKSSLLNALCGSEAHAENLYFSTLQTLTRRLRPELRGDRHANLLFTDTVGFIRDLPPWLVDAFSSTLEEIVASDVLLLTVDASETPQVIKEKLSTAWALLDQLHAPQARFLLLNKVDLLSSPSRSDILTSLSLSAQYPHAPFQWISTRTGEGLADLARRLLEDATLAHRIRIRLDPTRPGHLAFESWLRDHTEILERATRGTGMDLLVQCSSEDYAQLRRQGKHVDAALEEMASTGN